MNRAHQNTLCKALIAAKVGHLGKISNAAEGVLVNSRRALIERLIRFVARSQGITNTLESSRLTAEPLDGRWSYHLTVALH